MAEPQVSFAITAKNVAGDVIAQVTRDFDSLTRTVGGSGADFSRLHGSLKDVGESTEGARRGFTALERGLHSLGDELAGLPGPAGMLLKALEEFAGGSAVVVGVSAGLAVIAGAYELIAKNAERARKEHEDFMKSMDPSAFFAPDQTRPGTWSAFHDRAVALSHARPMLPTSMPDFFTQAMTQWAGDLVEPLVVNVSSAVLQRAAGLGVGANQMLAAGAETAANRGTADNLKFLSTTSKELPDPGAAALNSLMKDLEATARMDAEAIKGLQQMLKGTESPINAIKDKMEELKKAFDDGKISAKEYNEALGGLQGQMDKAVAGMINSLFGGIRSAIGGFKSGNPFSGISGILQAAGNFVPGLDAAGSVVGGFGGLFEELKGLGGGGVDPNTLAERQGRPFGGVPGSTGSAPVKVRIEEWSPNAVMPNPQEPKVISIGIVGSGSGAQLEQTKVVLARDAQRDAIVRIPRGVYLGP